MTAIYAKRSLQPFFHIIFGQPEPGIRAKAPFASREITGDNRGELAAVPLIGQLRTRHASKSR